jgi:hypothetical protein
MSKSNEFVANAFVRQIHARGGNMSCHRGHVYPLSATDTHKFAGNFAVLSMAYSYSTVIARTMQNQSTGDKELWITPRYYSSTTQRHKTHIIRAFDRWCEDAGQDTSRSIFHTYAAESALLNTFTNRNSDGPAYHALAAANSNMINADKPRIRDNTRRGVLRAEIQRLETAIKHMTLNVPLQHQNAKKVQEMADLHGFLCGALGLPVDELRVSVRAYTTLTTVGND